MTTTRTESWTESNQLSSLDECLPRKRSIIDIEIQALLNQERSALLIVFGQGQEEFVRTVGDVLGKSFSVHCNREAIMKEDLQNIVGISVHDYLRQWTCKDPNRLVINAQDVDEEYSPSDTLTEQCHYEYLYKRTAFDRRDLVRYLSFILGQVSPHKDLSKKERTFLISTTFPDINQALPNLEILSVGADAVELRVDLLKEPLDDGTFAKLPSLKYVGEQVMTLRQRTELPIILTTRCTNENGRFPMDDPHLFYQHLRKALQWGCEYIDVELWLPLKIRQRLAEQKGNSKIISAFHHFQGNFKWTGSNAQELFRAGATYGDVVKMIVYVNSMQENYELENFRSIIQAKYSHPPLSGLNMGKAGQISRSFNKIFTPVTHPLLPMIAAPGQLSVAEINSSLYSMGQYTKLEFYGIGATTMSRQATFFEKCFNELSLAHSFIPIERAPSSMEVILEQPNFGGASLNPALPVSRFGAISLSSSAKVTGLVDTIVVRSDESFTTFFGENLTWKGIKATLTRDFVPSAYAQRAALVLASSENSAASTILALKNLQIGALYTIGFKAKGLLAANANPLMSIGDLKAFKHPFVIINALPATKGLLVANLLKHYGSNGSPPGPTSGKVFLNLAERSTRADPVAVAKSFGWTAYDHEDVNAWTTVETLRILVGQNVPYDFVRLANGATSF